MSSVHDWTALIGEEGGQWSRDMWTSDIGPPELARPLSWRSRNIGGSMCYVIAAVGAASQDCEDSILSAFLESACALRTVYWDAVQKIERIVEEHKNDVIGILRMVLSNEDWNKRQEDLDNAISQTARQAVRLQSSINGLVERLVSITHAMESKNATVKDITKKLNNSRASFETRASVDIEECITRIGNSKQRLNQFGLAERSAQIIEDVHRGIGTHYTPDEAESTPTSHTQEDVAADIRLWLSGSKPVYFLCGEPGTGKSLMASALCDRLRSGQEHPVTLGASFFFAPNGPLGVALSSIFIQLSSQNSSKDLAALRNHLYRGDAPEQLLRDALTTAAPDAQVPTVLVVDAIDQCKESDEVSHLLRRMVTFARELPWLYIFLAARPRPNVMAVLTHPSFANIVHPRYLDSGIEKWDGNSRQYLEYVVPKIPGYSDYLRTHRYTLRRLIRRAGNDFPFALLATRYLDTDHTLPTEMFASLLAGYWRSPQDRCKTLVSLYLPMRPDNIALRVDKDWIKNVPTVLRFVTYSGPGLTSDLISAYAPSISTDDVISTVDHLRVGLTINQAGEIVPHDDSFRESLSHLRGDDYHTDREIHLTSISIAALSTASFVAAILQSHLPPTLLPCNNNKVNQPPPSLLALWQYHLSEYKPQSGWYCETRDFRDQFSKFSSSIMLALYAWVTEPSDIYRTASVVARYFAGTAVCDLMFASTFYGIDGSEDRSISRFYTFVTYVQLCRDHRDQDITAADVLEAIVKGCQGQQDINVSREHKHLGAEKLGFAMSFGLRKYRNNIALDAHSLEQYRSIMEEFLIQLRDSTSAADAQNIPGLLEGTFRIAR